MYQHWLILSPAFVRNSERRSKLPKIDNWNVVENGGRVFRRGYIQIENKNCATIKKKGKKKKELPKGQRFAKFINIRARSLFSIDRTRLWYGIFRKSFGYDWIRDAVFGEKEKKFHVVAWINFDVLCKIFRDNVNIFESFFKVSLISTCNSEMLQFFRVKKINIVY